MNQWGTAETKPPDNDNVRLCAAHVYLIIGAVSLILAVATLAIDQFTRLDANFGTYAILSVLSAVGLCGWIVQSIVQSAESRNRRELGQVLATMKLRQSEVLDQVAKLTAAVEGLTQMLAQPRVIHPAPSCRPAVGHMYASQAQQQTTPGVRPASVDRPTDPSGAALQAALEDGIEQGFDIGLRTQLAERGVPSLPLPRRRRLTGDS